MTPTRTPKRPASKKRKGEQRCRSWIATPGGRMRCWKHAGHLGGHIGPDGDWIWSTEKPPPRPQPDELARAAKAWRNMSPENREAVIAIISDELCAYQCACGICIVARAAVAFLRAAGKDGAR